MIDAVNHCCYIHKQCDCENKAPQQMATLGDLSKVGRKNIATLGEFKWL